uniref:hypothetical protein n=1 Tax=Candidatus Fimenecus sp. TaxID=3022888 RepID=UPI003FEFF65C
MNYNPTHWLDKVVDADTGELIQEGTEQSAARFNNMERGIFDAHATAAMLLIAAGQVIAEQTVEEKIVQLTSSKSYPFNNSQQSVPMATTRTTEAYTVEAEVMEHDGDVGDVIVSEKLLNGFKVRYDGSAKSATVKLIIKGGM